MSLLLVCTPLPVLLLRCCALLQRLRLTMLFNSSSMSAGFLLCLTASPKLSVLCLLPIFPVILFPLWYCSSLESPILLLLCNSPPLHLSVLPLPELPFLPYWCDSASESSKLLLLRNSSFDFQDHNSVSHESSSQIIWESWGVIRSANQASISNPLSLLMAGTYRQLSEAWPLQSPGGVLSPEDSPAKSSGGVQLLGESPKQSSEGVWSSLSFWYIMYYNTKSSTLVLMISFTDIDLICRFSLKFTSSVHCCVLSGRDNSHSRE